MVGCPGKTWAGGIVAECSTMRGVKTQETPQDFASSSFPAKFHDPDVAVLDRMAMVLQAVAIKDLDFVAADVNAAIGPALAFI